MEDERFSIVRSEVVRSFGMQCGTVYTDTSREDNENRTLVLFLDDEQNNSVGVVAIQEINGMEVVHKNIGTIEPDRIGEVLERWDLDRVKNVVFNGFGILSSPATEEEKQEVSKRLAIEYQKPPIILTHTSYVVKVFDASGEEVTLEN